MNQEQFWKTLNNDLDNRRAGNRLILFQRDEDVNSFLRRRINVIFWDGYMNQLRNSYNFRIEFLVASVQTCRKDKEIRRKLDFYGQLLRAGQLEARLYDMSQEQIVCGADRVINFLREAFI